MTQPMVCSVGNGTAVPCAGEFIPSEGCCLQHAALFDYWIADRGGSLVYEDEALGLEEKREHFRAFLDTLSPDAVKTILDS